MRPGRRFGGLNGTGELEWSHALGGLAETRRRGHRRPTGRGRSGAAGVSLFVRPDRPLSLPFRAPAGGPSSPAAPSPFIPAARAQREYTTGEISDGLISLRPPQNTLV